MVRSPFLGLEEVEAFGSSGAAAIVAANRLAAARAAPFPMSARNLIPVADKLDDRMTRHRFALHLADDAAR